MSGEQYLDRILTASGTLLDVIKSNSVTIANGLVYGLDLALVTCVWIGMCITWLICATCSGLLSLLLGFSALVQVLCEDFEYFLADACSFLQGVGWTVFQFLQIFCSAWEFLAEIPEVINKSLARFANYPFLQDVFHFFKIFNGSLLLIGSLIWAVPETLAYLVFQFAKSVVLSISLICDILTNIFLRVPYESALGLLLGLIVFYLNRRYRLNKKCWRWFIKALRMFYRLMKEATVYLQVVGWLFKRAVTNLISFRNCEISNGRRHNYSLAELKRKVVGAPSKIELITQLEKEREQKLCIVCMDRTRNVMLVDCRHMCMCQFCALEIYISTAECPICRKNISEFVTVFT